MNLILICWHAAAAARRVRKAWRGPTKVRRLRVISRAQHARAAHSAWHAALLACAAVSVGLALPPLLMELLPPGETREAAPVPAERRPVLVPEPSSVAILAAGLAGLAIARRRLPR